MMLETTLTTRLFPGDAGPVPVGSAHVPPPAAGYAHAAYAQSLAEFGAPRPLPRSGGWLLERAVPGTPHRDLCGPYPLLACRDWRGLAADLDELACRFVSAVAVLDPLGDYDRDALRRAFPDKLTAFKEHFVVELGRPPHEFVASHHRRNVRKALDALECRRVARPLDRLEDWRRLYDVLIARHAIAGVRAFSAAAFRGQLQTPGCTAFAAECDGRAIGMLLWYVAGETAYYHLGAFDDEGYRRHASFGLFWTAIESFGCQGLRWLDLGAGAGTEDRNDGLSRFKQGWATGRRTAWLAGRVLDRGAYDALAAAENDYFPAYRRGEFA